MEQVAIVLKHVAVTKVIFLNTFYNNCIKPYYKLKIIKLSLNINQLTGNIKHDTLNNYSTIYYFFLYS